MNIRIGMLGLIASGLAAFVATGAGTNEIEAVTNAANAASAPATEVLLPPLTGLFGVKFGEVLPADKGRTIAGGVVLAGFKCKTPFLGFTDFVQFATPETRQVFHIQASRTVVPGEERKLIDKVLRLVMFRFDLKATARDEDSWAMFFAGNDLILVSSRQGRVFIEAISDKLLTQSRVETKHLAEEKLKTDEARLRMYLDAMPIEKIVESKGGETKPSRVNSIFNRKFGEPMAEGEGARKLPDGSAYADFSVPAFFGCGKCSVFGSARTKKVYRIRAFWPDGADKARFADIRRAVEIALKVPMAETDENSCRLDYTNIFVTLVRNEEQQSIALDFTDKSVYAEHLDESAAMPDRAEWRDIEAL